VRRVLRVTTELVGLSVERLRVLFLAVHARTRHVEERSCVAVTLHQEAGAVGVDGHRLFGGRRVGDHCAVNHVVDVGEMIEIWLTEVEDHRAYPPRLKRRASRRVGEAGGRPHLVVKAERFGERPGHLAGGPGDEHSLPADRHDDHSPSGS